MVWKKGEYVNLLWMELMSKKKDIGNWAEPKQNQIAREKKTATHRGRRKKKHKKRGVKARKDLIMAEYKRMMWYKDAMEDEEKRRAKEKKIKVGNYWYANWRRYYNDAQIKLSILVEDAVKDRIDIEEKYKQ